MILVLYWKIYKIARKRIQRRTKRLQYAQSTTKDVVSCSFSFHFMHQSINQNVPDILQNSKCRNLVEHFRLE